MQTTPFRSRSLALLRASNFSGVQSLVSLASTSRCSKAEWTKPVHEQVFQGRVDKAIRVMEAIGELEDPAHQLQLLRACASALRVLHGLRVCPPRFIEGVVNRFDEALWDALRDIVVAGGPHFGEVEFQWASLPSDRGGLGVARASSLAQTAFVSSYTSSLALQDLLLSSDEYVRPPPLSSFTQARDSLQSALPDVDPAHFARPNPTKSWAKPLIDAKVEWIKERSPRARDLLPMTSTAPPGWMLVPPCPQRCYRLSKVELRAIIQFRLGIKMFAEDRCPKCHGAQDCYGDHAVNCGFRPGFKRPFSSLGSFIAAPQR